MQISMRYRYKDAQIQTHLALPSPCFWKTRQLENLTHKTAFFQVFINLNALHSGCKIYPMQKLQRLFNKFKSFFFSLERAVWLNETSHMATRT